ncbi:hypothetical protein HRI_000735800 [Hibiscus trionum]|uniref:Endonuclease/exonuclease/phosphatase domain-containing protein n=1 Tax=Hibiscus trionum TaxID=183268 RepID=A0A9W7H438_HIBTR|nr:hypothetical protein HRI_000735800 [Hibiscus trionum]
MEGLAPVLTFQWVLGGDFNIILFGDERTGCVSQQIGGSRLFSEFLFNCELSDLGFSGPPFTWSRRKLFQRLDRYVVNSALLSCYPNSYMQHLERLGSDHRPLVLHHTSIEPMILPRPFRYIDAWQDPSDFSDFLN